MTHLKSIFSILILALGAFSFTACDQQEILAEILSEREAVELLEAALQTEAGGLTTDLENLTKTLTNAVASGELCDSLYTRVLEESHNGLQLTGSYATELSYELTCNSVGLPLSATFTTATEANYTTTRISSDDEADFAGTLDGLLPIDTEVSINGDYLKIGEQDFNAINEREVDSELEMIVTELHVDKESYLVASGSAAFVYSGTTAQGDFSYSGSIIFNGGNTATVTINGTAYDIDWN